MSDPIILNVRPRPVRKRKAPIWPYMLLGALFGFGLIYWLHRPSTPLTLTFLHGAAPKQVSQLDGKEGDIESETVWVIPGTLDSVKREAESELTLADGWQPPTKVYGGAPNWQFVQVRTPNGNFRFTRLLLREDGPQSVKVELQVSNTEQMSMPKQSSAGSTGTDSKSSE